MSERLTFPGDLASASPPAGANRSGQGGTERVALAATQSQPKKHGWNLRILNADPERQRAVRANVSSESLAENGRRGYAATKARFGGKWAIEALARHRRTNPSRIVRAVMAWLDEFCVGYELERRIGDTFADIACDGFGLIVEVDSDRYHQAAHRSNDSYKDDLYRRQGWRVLRLTEGDIKSGAAKHALDHALHNSEAAWRRN